MKIHLHSSQFILALCFVTVAAFSVNGQTVVERYGSNEIFTPKILLREWRTNPILSEGVKETTETRVKVIEETQVQMKGHWLDKEQLLFMESCNPDFDKKESKNKNRMGFLLKAYATYEIKGTVFGYRMPLAYATTQNGRIKERAGAQRIANYIDEDGSGKFKLRCDKKLEITTLPEWVKTLAAK